MIINALLDIMHGLIAWIIANRPAWDVHLPDGVQTLISALKGFDNFLPVTETFTVIAARVALFAATTGVKWTIKVVDYVADVIP